MALDSERPKPEFSAETGTGTEIIPVRFRLGNSYRNRNGPLLLLWLVHNSKWPVQQVDLPEKASIYVNIIGISIILHKNLLYRVISLYCRENLPLFFRYLLKIRKIQCKLWKFWKYSIYCFGIEFRFRFGFGSVKNPYFGFGPVSVKFYSGRSLLFFLKWVFKNII